MLETFLAVLAALTIVEIYRAILMRARDNKAAALLEMFYDQQEEKRDNAETAERTILEALRATRKNRENPLDEEWTHLDR